MPGGGRANESARKSYLWALFFDGQGVSQEAQGCQWVAWKLCRSAPFQEIVHKLGHRRDACDQQMISRPRACDVKQVPLRVVHLFQIRIVRHRFNAIRLRDDIVVTGHHHDGPELQPFGEMHRADGNGVSALHQNARKRPPRRARTLPSADP